MSTAHGSWRITAQRDPVRLVFSGSPWRAAEYLLSWMLVSWVPASVVLGAAAVAATFAVSIVAIPLLAAAASAVHWSAAVERRRLGQVLADPVLASYRQPDRPGTRARAVTAWRDRATWREIGYLAGMWVPLGILDTVVVSVWAVLLAGITIPVWYWAPHDWSGFGYVNGRSGHGVPIGYFPHGATGPGAAGVFVHTLPQALLVALVSAIAFALFSYVLVATARVHARVGRALLGPPADPLAEARQVLSVPGPLGPLTGSGPAALPPGG